jgi:hypothetical protein
MRHFLPLLVALIFFAPIVSHGQSSRWEAGLALSEMTPNNFNMLEYSATAVSGELSWWHVFQDDEWWVVRRKNPAFGIRGSFAFIPTGIAGHRLGVVGIIRAPLWKRLDYHIGAGLSGYTRSSYFTHDTANIFISTLISCLIDVGFDYCLNDRLSASLALLHSSNGMLNRPNKGLNFLQLSLSYRLSGPGYRSLGTVSELPHPVMDSRHEIGATFQGGIVASRDLRLDGYYPCYDLSLNYQYYLDPVVAVGGTLDMWYNGSHYRLARMLDESYTFPCYVSMLGFIEGKWDRISIKAGLGPVLVAPPRVNIRFYERVGVYYNMGKHYVGVSLHAHAGVIEFIEWGYGFRIPIK